MQVVLISIDLPLQAGNAAHKPTMLIKPFFPQQHPFKQITAAIVTAPFRRCTIGEASDRPDNPRHVCIYAACIRAWKAQTNKSSASHVAQADVVYGAATDRGSGLGYSYIYTYRSAVHMLLWQAWGHIQEECSTQHYICVACVHQGGVGGWRRR